MPVVATINKRRFVIKPIPTRQMRQIGNAGLAAEKGRMLSGLNVRGEPAKSLTDPYGKRKVRAGRPNLRDLFLSGATMDALQVKSVSSSRIVLGPTNSFARMIVIVQNKKEFVWGSSAAGVRAVNQAVAKALQGQKLVHLEQIT